VREKFASRKLSLFTSPARIGGSRFLSLATSYAAADRDGPRSGGGGLKMRPPVLILILIIILTSLWFSVQVEQEDLRRFGCAQFQQACFTDCGGIASVQFVPVQ